MNALLTSLNTANPLDPRLEQIVEVALARLQAGEPIDVAALAATHPEFAAELQELLPTVARLVRMGNSPQEHTDAAAMNHRPAGLPHQQLGDFRILREIGRGGMGMVYEAEQLSMGRCVALKVLPFAALVDDKSLQRFRNEVRAAAALDHPHIVPIYSVGEDRGVHFYAMQLIRGQSLAELVEQLRAGRRSGVERQGSSGVEEEISRVVEQQNSSYSTIPLPIYHTAQPPAETAPIAGLSTRDTANPRAYFHHIARLGIEAAEALQHAHDLGVLHRDIKPSNLLLDRAGKLYVTDFGLARIGTDAGMTMTGDVIGTLRYMAPEQALGKRVVIDHRTDVYSLGATLYELLALQPAFDEPDRSELLKQIAFEEPKPLRKLDRDIPAELETIVLKALAKNPDERYQTAHWMADDLQAFLEDKPIKARPPTQFQRCAKWARRNRPLVWAMATTLIVSALVVAGSAGWIIRDRQTRQAAVEERILYDLGDIRAAYEQDDLPAAMGALSQAESLLATSFVRADAWGRIQQWRMDLQMVQQLELVRLDKSTMFRDDQWDLLPTADGYRKAFVAYNLDLDSNDHVATVNRIRKSQIKPHLIAAIDDWAAIEEGQEQATLLRVSRAADDDPWRNRLRDAIEQNDVSALKAVIEEGDQLARSRLAIVTVTNRLMKSGQQRYAIDVLRRMHRNHEQDFWLNFTLGVQLQESASGEAIGYLLVALSQRPDSGAARNALGNAFYFSRDFERAEVEFREACRLQPDRNWHVYNHVGVLMKLGRAADAEQECRKGMRLVSEKNSDLYLWFGRALSTQGKLAEAEQALHEAIRLDPANPPNHIEMAKLHIQQERWSEAKSNLHDAIQLEPSKPCDIIAIARILATAESENIRDGKLAVKLAAKVCELSKNRHAGYLDTLAAAYAEVGDFDSSVKFSEMAVDLARDNVEIAGHLKRFRSGKPLREK